MGATLERRAAASGFARRWCPRAACIELGPLRAAGSRAYLAVRGGIDVPAYLGSRATFTLGLFGGHGGRALQAGDVLHIGASSRAVAAAAVMSSALIPRLTDAWEIAVLNGPHGAPDFFTETDIDAALRDRVAGPLQLQPHRRPADRAQAALGAPGRRRGGPAPVEHPRQRLRGRHHRLHGRHADHPRPRRPQPGRLRLPGDDRRGRAVEGRPAQGRRQRALRSRVAGRGAPPARRPRSAEIDTLRADGVYPLAPSPVAPSADPGDQRGGPGAARPSSSVRTATPTCWSNTGRWCWIWGCASACTR